ncbi:uncharacterized protein [Miscanthus floridulus]|uniref:uncharacterized protein n=1 Tax=Miscanthus floridulus TaxID=154761 RepID=UPI0034592443
MATRTPPALMDEHVEEILLRIPPDDPARLVRASIACKRWCRLVCDPGFRRRFRERHRTPPLLGVIRYCHVRGRDRVARFVPTCSFRPRRADRHGWHAIDCRLGRVLLRSEPWSSSRAGERRECLGSRARSGQLPKNEAEAMSTKVRA